MRILELGKFYPPVRGGIESLLKSFCEGFVGKGAEVECVVANSNSKTEHERSNGFEVIRCGSYGTMFSTSISPNYISAAKKSRAEIWHAHFPNPLADLSVLRAPKNARVVITYHSDIVRQSGLMSLYGGVVDRCLERADKIVVASPRHLEFSPRLQRHREKVVVIPFGIDAEQISRRAAPPAGISTAQRPILLTVGRLVGYKGHRFLIEAMKNLNATLWIVGRGPLDNELRAHVLHGGLRDRVRFFGNVSDEELPAFYQSCDMFVLPSITPNEAFGVVQLEAMACGKPVISCDLQSGVPWVNQHEATGLIVPPANSDALASAVNRLANDADLARRFGEAGRRRVIENFSEQRMIDDCYRLFEALC